MATDDFFRARLDNMVDLRHPLAVLASRMPWSEIEAALAPAFSHKDHKGRAVERADMLDLTFLVASADAPQASSAAKHVFPMVFQKLLQMYLFEFIKAPRNKIFYRIKDQRRHA